MNSNVALWKTCRVLANETRLNALRLLMHNGEMCVQEIAEAETVSEVVASQHLKLLHEHGFLEKTTKSKWVFYSAAALPKTYAAFFLAPLKKELHISKTKTAAIIRYFTAFTHPRRIDLLKTLNLGNRTFEQLACECNISDLALYRHLRKLRSRQFVIKKNGNTYSVFRHQRGLKKALLRACEASPFYHTS